MLPMFPLGTVLFPGTLLPLHVFEPRYRALTGWCLERDGRLGVVLIERGSEVGGGDVRFGTGTQGRIVESKALPDGRWLVAVEGERRIRVREWLAEEPFPQAEVEYLEDTGDTGDTGDAVGERIERQAQRALALKARLGEWPEDATDIRFDSNPAAAAWQIAALGLFGPADAQRLLETDDVGDRLARLAALVDDAVDLLALRAGER